MSKDITDELIIREETSGYSFEKSKGNMEEDINKLIEELTNVRPDELSAEGLKLFNKITQIIDKHIEETEKHQKYARGDFKKGIQAGIRKEAERIKEILK